MSLPLVDSLNHLVLAAEAAPTMSFDLVSMWRSMGFFARFIAVVLGIMSIYSLGVMAERLVTYARATGASRQYAEQLRGLLPERRYADAIALAKKLGRGHLAKVLGLAIEEYDRGVRAMQTRGGASEVGEFDVIAAGVNNVFDANPARVYNGSQAQSDASTYDYMGRYFYLRLTQAI